jgi:hypothetical protein
LIAHGFCLYSVEAGNCGASTDIDQCLNTDEGHIQSFMGPGVTGKDLSPVDAKKGSDEDRTIERAKT